MDKGIRDLLFEGLVQGHLRDEGTWVPQRTKSCGLPTPSSCTICSFQPLQNLKEANLSSAKWLANSSSSALQILRLRPISVSHLLQHHFCISLITATVTPQKIAKWNSTVVVVNSYFYFFWKVAIDSIIFPTDAKKNFSAPQRSERTTSAT